MVTPSTQPPARGVRPAERVFTNGIIYTLGSKSTVAQALAIRGGKFVYVGTDEGAKRYAGPSTEVVDLNGKFVLPGFVDSHAHLSWGSIFDVYGVVLPGGMPTDQYVPTVKAFADAHPEVAAIRGWGWDIAAYLLGGPRKEGLDAVIPDRPVAINDSSLHNLWCNSKALEIAGITKDTPDPPNGTIEKDPVTGEPTGTLRESACRLATSRLPDFTVEQYVAAVTHFQCDVAAPVGVTTVFDPLLDVGGNAQKALERMAQAGTLTMRVRAALLIDPNEPLESQLVAARKERDSHKTALFRTDSAKFFVDGVGYSGYMLEPFANAADAGFASDYRGYSAWASDQLADASIRFAKEGFHLHYHAIGDAAVRETLDSVEAAEEALGSTALRPAMTHIFWIHPSDMPRLAKLKSSRSCSRPGS